MGARSGGGGAWSSSSLATNMKMSAVTGSEKKSIMKMVGNGHSGQAALQYVKTGSISSKNAITKQDKALKKYLDNSPGF